MDPVTQFLTGNGSILHLVSFWTMYCIHKNNCGWALNAIFERLIFWHLSYIAFTFQKVCSSLHKLQDHNFYSSHLFLNRSFRIYLSRIYFYLYGVGLSGLLRNHQKCEQRSMQSGNRHSSRNNWMYISHDSTQIAAQRNCRCLDRYAVWHLII